MTIMAPEKPKPTAERLESKLRRQASKRAGSANIAFQTPNEPLGDLIGIEDYVLEYRGRHRDDRTLLQRMRGRKDT